MNHPILIIVLIHFCGSEVIGIAIGKPNASLRTAGFGQKVADSRTYYTRDASPNLMGNFLEDLLDELKDGVSDTLQELLNDILGDQKESLKTISQQKDMIPIVISNVTHFMSQADDLIRKFASFNMSMGDCDVGIAEVASQLLQSIEAVALKCLDDLEEHVNKIVDPIVKDVDTIQTNGNRLIEEAASCLQDFDACGMQLMQIAIAIKDELDAIGRVLGNVADVEKNFFLDIPEEADQCIFSDQMVDVFTKLMNLIACLNNLTKQ